MGEFLYLVYMEFKTRLFLMILGSLIFIVGFFSPRTCLEGLTRLHVVQKQTDD
jgi:hypothetical protein